jgi:hypothetical protein
MNILHAAAEILKLGTSGGLFMLSFLSFQLLANEQKQRPADAKMLRAIASYRAYALVCAVVLLCADIGVRIADSRLVSSQVRLDAPACLKQIDRLDTIARGSPTLDELQSASKREADSCGDFVRSISDKAAE